MGSLPGLGQDRSDGPANEKAQKTYREGLEYLRDHRLAFALDKFKKADKQDSGRCLACQHKMMQYGVQLDDWKTAELGAEEILKSVQGEKNLAIAHYNFGMVLMKEALRKNKDDLFVRVHDQMTDAVASYSNFSAAFFADGRALAHLSRDDEAKLQFEKVVKTAPTDNLDRRRALRFISEPALARARMAPAFEITTADGQRVCLDELQGKVVLIDFWATWCGPCRKALPHIREIVKKFQDQPLVVLSISLDDDEQKWKDFVAKHQMTWLQYPESEGFRGPIATSFDVNAIPHAFTVDTDGVLQDEHIGDAAIEGKLNKLVARARESQVAQATTQ